MPRDLTATVVRDHRRLESHLDRILDLGDPIEWRRSLIELRSALAAHTWAEESVIYPVVRHELSGGEAAVTASVYEDLRLAGTMERLSAAHPDDPDTAALCRSLSLELRFHIGEEESGWLAAMQRALEPTRRQELARQFVAAQRFSAAAIPEVSEFP